MIEIARLQESIVGTTFKPGWTWDDYRRVHGESLLALLDEATSPVYLIGDLTHADTPKEAIPTLPDIAAMRFWHHPKLAHVYLYGATGFVRVVAEVFAQVYGGVTLVETKADALALISATA